MDAAHAGCADLSQLQDGALGSAEESQLVATVVWSDSPDHVPAAACLPAALLLGATDAGPKAGPPEGM